MARYSAYTHELADVERRMERLEQRLEQLGRVASRSAASGVAGAQQAADRFSDALVTALSDLIDRFRGGARDLGEGAAQFKHDAARLGYEASRVGGDALRRLSTEVERRPLVTLAVAVGIGVLIGLSSSARRR
jgi:hypothetical protein